MSELQSVTPPGQRAGEDLQRPDTGSGSLLQRDYWAVIRGCEVSPRVLMKHLRRRFQVFAPPDLVEFRRRVPAERPLERGDELAVNIKHAGSFAVRVTHADANSITLGTLRGHPEAGRITFGAYRNGRSDVIFHIRSIARSSSRRNYAGFLLAGDPMQTYTWTDFVDCVAHTFGEGVVGSIRADVKRVRAEDEDGDMERPTFLARGE